MILVKSVEVSHLCYLYFSASSRIDFSVVADRHLKCMFATPNGLRMARCYTLRAPRMCLLDTTHE